MSIEGVSPAEALEEARELREEFELQCDIKKYSNNQAC
jgi:hypothetical protein